MKTFNKRGDKGETSLLFGKRVSKADLHCEAYGTIDEAISSLGVARNAVKKEKSRDIILKVQKELFTVNAELATQCEDFDKLTTKFAVITPEMVDQIEGLIDGLESQIEMPRAFIIPGANMASASIDVSRAIVRRAERRLVMLHEKGEIRNEVILQYLNRLADLLFTLARYEEASK
ncbi:MAG: cob(I)yrinic acid a,c-diamide adenosyltransferase [Dehalococcoidales bacterium]|nr:cob(I)yrinic acid a,c-diamide adenosyltransferase [Dehalococcoidales bacterium]